MEGEGAVRQGFEGALRGGVIAGVGDAAGLCKTRPDLRGGTAAFCGFYKLIHAHYGIFATQGFFAVFKFHVINIGGKGRAEDCGQGAGVKIAEVVNEDVEIIDCVVLCGFPEAGAVE